MRRTYRAVVALLPLLPRGGSAFLRGYVVVSSVLAVLDLAALALVAAAMPALIGGGEASLPLIGVIDASPALLLGGVAGVIILKGALGVLMQWLLTRRFAQYELAVGDQLLSAYLRAPWERRTSYNSAVLVRVADSGIANTVMGVLLPVAQVPAELATFAAVTIGVTILDPLLALVTLGYLGLIGFGLVGVMSRKAVVAGRVNRDYAFRTASLITEAVASLKELTVRRRVDEVLQRVHDLRVHTARARANISFLSSAPRYVLESALVIGFGVVGGVAYLVGGPAQAATAVGLFGVAGFRIVPSLTRLQGIATQTSSNVPHAETVTRDIEEARRLAVEESREDAEDQGRGPLPLDPPRELSFVDVSYRYPTGSNALTSVDLSLPIGSTLALVGASGSGKSTAIDLMLGLLEPTEGRIVLDGADLRDVRNTWQRRVAYVPQEVVLLDGTIGQNVALTWDKDYDRERVLTALGRAQALDILESRPDGLDTRVGERGLGLSGGQRQRIGMARALYSDPFVLVLDEATSALDGETESRVAAAVAELAGDMTIVTVAHRLATIRGYDRIAVLDRGRIIGIGTFDELVATVPTFATQARHAGLLPPTSG